MYDWAFRYGERARPVGTLVEPGTVTAPPQPSPRASSPLAPPARAGPSTGRPRHGRCGGPPARDRERLVPVGRRRHPRRDRAPAARLARRPGRRRAARRRPPPTRSADVLHLRLAVPDDLSADVLAVLEPDHAVCNLAVTRGGSLKPAGDLVEADIAREATDAILRPAAGPRAARPRRHHDPQHRGLAVPQRGRGGEAGTRCPRRRRRLGRRPRQRRGPVARVVVLLRVPLPGDADRLGRRGHRLGDPRRGGDGRGPGVQRRGGPVGGARARPPQAVRCGPSACSSVGSPWPSA